MQANHFRFWNIAIPWKVILVLLAVEPLVVVMFYSFERSRLRGIQKKVPYGNNGPCADQLLEVRDVRFAKPSSLFGRKLPDP